MITALGFMSGTSMDGVDAAIIRSDGENQLECGATYHLPYSRDFRQKIKACLGQEQTNAQILELEHELTLYHLQAFEKIKGATKIDLIGFHGHTLTHLPQKHFTWQIGDGCLLADKTGIDVVYDFRSKDVALGGQGAPLVPIYHQALVAHLPKPLMVLNIGGVSNVTYIGEELIAFDVGPGNAPIDDAMRLHYNQDYDKDGQVAANGTVNEDHLQTWLKNAFFDKKPPKSLDRQDFCLTSKLEPQDEIATKTAFVALSVQQSLRHLPTPPLLCLVTGGGRHNKTLMGFLKSALACEVQNIDVHGWDGDFSEAQAFAYLAIRHKKGLPISFPKTTGVLEPLSGGRLITH